MRCGDGSIHLRIASDASAEEAKLHGVTTVRVRAPAKINLSLRVVGRRTDGYHLLDSYVVPISLFDSIAISIEPAGVPGISFSSDHPELRGDVDLTVRAARLFMARTGTCLKVDISLTKEIPIGAGLGGGSSDAAAVLLALRRATGVPRERDSVREWSVELGADVPFFAIGRPARIRGIGELVTPIPSPFRGALVVAFPGTGLATAEVYRAYGDSLTNKPVESTIRGSALESVPLKDDLVNDLEGAATRILPAVETLKSRLRELGAAGALMTGSGSAVFGTWDEMTGAQRAARALRDAGTWARAVEVLERSPVFPET